MEYRRLGKSGLKVSELGLGTNTFGRITDEPTSFSIINRALEAGVNYMDTADVYAGGKSEEIVGRAIKDKRAQFILATKFGYPSMVGPREAGGSLSFVIKALEASLRRLNTDYIDLYYFHFPDVGTPIEETLRALDDIVRSGKVRYIGCSNFAAWQLCEAMWASKVHNLVPFVAAQSKYNLLDRSIEKEVAPCCQSYGVGFVPWGPLASGFLTGKYKHGEKIPAGARLEKPISIYADVVSETNYAKVAKLEAFAKERNHTVGELAIAWLLSRPWLSSVNAGATSADQLSTNLKAVDWKLTADEVAQIDKMV